MPKWIATPGRSEPEMPKAAAYRLTWLPEREVYELRESQSNPFLSLTVTDPGCCHQTEASSFPWPIAQRCVACPRLVAFY